MHSTATIMPGERKLTGAKKQVITSSCEVLDMKTCIGIDTYTCERIRHGMLKRVMTLFRTSPSANPKAPCHDVVKNLHGGVARQFEKKLKREKIFMRTYAIWSILCILSSGI